MKSGLGSTVVWKYVGKIVGKIVVANWLTRGSTNTKRNGGYAQLWQPIGREK